MEVVTQKAPAKDEPTGTPIIVSDQPTAPSTGAEPTESKSKDAASRVAAIKAKLAAGKSTETAAAPSASPAATAPAEITDEAISKAADKAAEVAAAKAATITPEDDFATKAAKAAELAKAGKALEALEILGIPLDAAVRQATGAPATTTEEEKLKAENAKLRADAVEAARKADEAAATARAEAAYHRTVAAIVTDAAFPKITTAAQVSEALAEAKTAYKALVADVGRDLNETEKDRLVRHYLKRYNDRAMASEQPSKRTARDEPSVKTGTVAPARPAKRSVAQVKADILSGKSKHN